MTRAETPHRAPEVGRRTFLGWALAGPTLMVAAPVASTVLGADPAGAVIPSPPEFSDGYDLGDLQDDAAAPTSHLITVVVHKNGTASFALPRAEVGQGITTSTAMIIAEELDIAVDKVDVTLANARPELVYNQLTGGSNTTRSTYEAIRVAAALARLQLVQAAAKQWGVSVDQLSTRRGTVYGPGTRRVGYGLLAEAAAVSTATRLQVTLKSASQFSVLGRPHNRIDALEAVTGRKRFTGDLQIPNALPTMVARPPTIKGTPKSVSNLAQVRAMPGITDVAMISTGVAVRGHTFGQCIDAIRALHVTWNKGTEDGKSDRSVRAELKAAELPLADTRCARLGDDGRG